LLWIVVLFLSFPFLGTLRALRLLSNASEKVAVNLSESLRGFLALDSLVVKNSANQVGSFPRRWRIVN
jgi:hypothetical protein